MAEGEPTYNFISTPDYLDDHLFETVGYVEYIRVEQVGGRSTLQFLLEISLATGNYHLRCIKFLDVNTTVALAQLQLLRDAMWSGRVGATYLIRVVFNFAEMGRYDKAYFYELFAISSDTYPVSPLGYFGPAGEWGMWYVHDPEV